MAAHSLLRIIGARGAMSVWTRCLLVFGLSLGLMTAVIPPAAIAADTGATTRNTPGGTGLVLTVADGVGNVFPQAGGFFNKLNRTDTAFTLRGASTVIRSVDTIFSDTIGLTLDDGQTAGDTDRKVVQGDTATFILSVTNLGNTVDSIGFVIDTVTVNGYTGLDTMSSWSISFTDSSGRQIGNRIYTRGLDTAFIKLSPNRMETFAVKVSDSGSPETSWINFRVQSYVSFGNSTKFAVRAYRGLNGDTFGGDGHDSITLFVDLIPISKLLGFKADTVFSPLSLGGTNGNSKTDTQHYVPGAIVVNTLWFDNDDSSAFDTIVLEDWIDTRYVQFDSAGLRRLIGQSGQVSAAGPFVSGGYGNIFIDSGMPAITGAKFNVKLEYYKGSGLQALTPTVALADVGRIRWTISNLSPTDTTSVRGHNSSGAGESPTDAPVAFGASTDIDMGYVRYAVVIRTDTAPAGPGRPDSGAVISAVPSLAGFSDSAFVAPVSLVPRTNIVKAFTAEFLPKPVLTPETTTAQKVQRDGGDTFFFTHKVNNGGNGPDSIALTGTTALTSSGAYVTIFKDIGVVGSYDGFEPKAETIGLNAGDTMDLLVAVFMPGSFSGVDTAFIRAVSVPRPVFYDTANDFLTVVATSQAFPDTGQPSAIVGAGSDSLSFTILTGVPPTEDTVTITLTNTAVVGKDSTTITFDTAGNIKVNDSTVSVKYDSTTGQLIISFLGLPSSDTYISTTSVQDAESGVVKVTTDTGTFVVDTVPPFFTDTRVSAIFIADTTLTGAETAVSLKLRDTALGDANTGIETFVISVLDTAGKLLRTDTLVGTTLNYQLPIDTAGAYQILLTVYDDAGNKVTLPDTFVLQIPVHRTIDVVAQDKEGNTQGDDIAKGLTAQAKVTVLDPTANANPATKQSIAVTITSDLDVAGFRLELFETGNNTGQFEGTFKFTNGASNESALKIKVRDGSPVRATYDADGSSGSVAAILDQILWQGVFVKDVERVRTWPNPFNPAEGGEILMQNLPSDVGMVIEIYNLNAEKIKTLRVNDGINFSATQNLGHWDGRNLRGEMVSSGTYIYLVRTSFGVTKTGRFTLVK